MLSHSYFMKLVNMVEPIHYSLNKYNLHWYELLSLIKCKKFYMDHLLIFLGQVLQR